MKADTPLFVVIGRNSTLLENYRLELSSFNVALVPLNDDETPEIPSEISHNESISGILIDLHHIKLDELSKLSTIFALDAPIIVVFDSLVTKNVTDFGKLAALGPSVRLMKSPLIQGEIAQAAKNILSIHSRERFSAIQSLLRGLTHELNNIVLRILGRADLLLTKDDISQIHSGLQNVVKAGERAQQLTKGLQSFAHLTYRPASGRISSSIQAALARFKPRMMSQKTTVLKKGLLLSPEKEPDFVFDQELMAEVFSHIIENSLHAMPDQGVVTISVTKSVGVRIQITDTGSGMPSDVSKRAFEAGFSTHKETASGLGLTFARELVFRHGGTIHLSSMEGQGTEISIWLPA